jgi:hypothetical protein
MTRPEVVNAVIHSLASFDARQLVAALEMASQAEVNAAVEKLAAAAAGGCRPVPPIVTLSYWDLLRLGSQGWAMLQVASYLAPTWAAWPDRDRATVLKIEPPHRIAFVRDKLQSVGFELG